MTRRLPRITCPQTLPVRRLSAAIDITAKRIGWVAWMQAGERRHPSPDCAWAYSGYMLSSYRQDGLYRVARRVLKNSLSIALHSSASTPPSIDTR